METKAFERFVAGQQGGGNDSNVNWTQLRDEWLGDLDAFYDDIIEFLKKYIEAGSITYDFAEIGLTEPDIGSYLARRMDIRIGRQDVSLVPIGTMLVGCRGRVDVHGSAGRASIVLVNQKARSAADLIQVRISVGGRLPSEVPPAQEPISWAWKIVSNTMKRTFVDFDQDSFFSLLMQVANA